MLKKYFWLAVATLIFTFQMMVGSAFATELNVETRTVPKNAQGDTIVLTLKQVKKGKRLFNNTCSQCHNGGVTKTDPNIGLEPETLALATPPRNNIESLVDYIKNPTTYDGETSIAETHPSIKSSDVFSEMRDLSDEDLTAIAGHILIQPKINGVKWGGGKIYF